MRGPRQSTTPDWHSPGDVLACWLYAGKPGRWEGSGPRMGTTAHGGRVAHGSVPIALVISPQVTALDDTLDVCVYCSSRQDCEWSHKSNSESRLARAFVGHTRGKCHGEHGREQHKPNRVAPKSTQIHPSTDL